jgi:hypothetical protein
LIVRVREDDRGEEIGEEEEELEAVEVEVR